MIPLAFAYFLPSTGRIQVFHPLEMCAAGRTREKAEQNRISALPFARRSPILVHISIHAGNDDDFIIRNFALIIKQFKIYIREREN